MTLRTGPAGPRLAAPESPMTVPVPELTVAFLLVFARVGTLVMLLPAFGERPIPSRVRLTLALLLTLVMLPLVGGLFGAPAGPAGPIGTLVGEIAVGLVLGLAARMVMAALQTAGTVIAGQLGLSFATTIDPTIGGQDASLSNFLSLLGVTLIFAADLHHLVIAAIRDSYTLLPPVGLPDTGDAARLAVAAVGRGFSLGVRIAAPFIAFGLLFNLGLGILSRLMPQMQVFFLGVPLTILVGMLILLATLGLMMGVFVTDLGRYLQGAGPS